MKNLLIIIFMFILASCAGNFPRMERKVKIWNGAPEEVGICRMSTKELVQKAEINIPERLVRKFHQGHLGMECIGAEDKAFAQYACLTFQDLGVLNAYIEKIIYSCKKWK